MISNKKAEQLKQKIEDLKSELQHANYIRDVSTGIIEELTESNAGQAYVMRLMIEAAGFTEQNAGELRFVDMVETIRKNAEAVKAMRQLVWEKL